MARRTKAEAQATRNSLLDAAEQLFQTRGVSRTSLNDIATAAGTTRGAIYWHFKDKADLFNAMMERVTLPLEEIHAQASAMTDGHALGQLRTALLNALHLIATDTATRRVLEIATQKIELTNELVSVQERRLHSHRRCVEQNQLALASASRATQQPLTIPLDTAAIGLQALIEGLVQRWLLDPQAFDLEQTGQQTMDVYLAGLGLPIKHLSPIKTPCLSHRLAGGLGETLKAQ
ncbi:TetR family transcriptional regulator [Giesbergeria anulus]|uniref:Transcriptional regulator, TetR family n=1 Tax=Giesbergeria anulus TaxID=180197 RepID=A0A1H9IFW9_9BURK|nr:TetR family transcriptional regulator [Giesbergeria anulus]SEQ73466.1 transcriptional regulator, TetR family [Giesbergeria anulus]